MANDGRQVVELFNYLPFFFDRIIIREWRRFNAPLC